MSDPPGNRAHEDRGAALILAIGFVVMIGAISAGLAGLASSSVTNRGTLEAVRNRQYSADGVIEETITQVRAQAGSALAACQSAGGSRTGRLNNIAIRVEWQNACGVVRGSDDAVVAQRNVIFTACQDTGVPCAPNTVIIRAQVNFQAVGSGATVTVTRTWIQSWSVNR